MEGEYAAYVLVGRVGQRQRKTTVAGLDVPHLPALPAAPRPRL